MDVPQNRAHVFGARGSEANPVHMRPEVVRHIHSYLDATLGVDRPFREKTRLCPFLVVPLADAGTQSHSAKLGCEPIRQSPKSQNFLRPATGRRLASPS